MSRAKTVFLYSNDEESCMRKPQIKYDNLDIRMRKEFS